MKKVGKILLIIVLVLVVLVLLVRWNNKKNEKPPYDPTENFAAFTWPESELIDRIPKPEKVYGDINHEEAGSFRVDIGDVTREQFDAYMEACIDAGFTVDYHKSSTSYWAYDAEGYYLHISYDDEYKIMDISTRDPEEEKITTTEVVQTTTTKGSDGNISKDFKAAMDVYEAFIDEYVDIVKKYKANPTDLSILEDYTDYMSRYTEVCNAFAEWEDEELSTEELAYYADVQLRASKKLLEVAQ